MRRPLSLSGPPHQRPKEAFGLLVVHVESSELRAQGQEIHLFYGGVYSSYYAILAFRTRAPGHMPPLISHPTRLSQNSCFRTNVSVNYALTRQENTAAIRTLDETSICADMAFPSSLKRFSFLWQHDLSYALC